MKGMTEYICNLQTILMTNWFNNKKCTFARSLLTIKVSSSCLRYEAMNQHNQHICSINLIFLITNKAKQDFYDYW